MRPANITYFVHDGNVRTSKYVEGLKRAIQASANDDDVLAALRWREVTSRNVS